MYIHGLLQLQVIELSSNWLKKKEKRLPQVPGQSRCAACIRHRSLNDVFRALIPLAFNSAPVYLSQFFILLVADRLIANRPSAHPPS